MISASLLIAQAAPVDSGVWGSIREFGVAIVGLVVVTTFLGWFIRLVIKYLMDQNTAWEKRWQDEHDLRVAAEHRADVAVEQARTANAFYEALKQQSKGT